MSVLKKLILAIFCFLSFVMVVIVCLPQILSSHWSQGLMESWISKHYALEIELKKATFAWFDDQQLEADILKNKEGPKAGSVDMNLHATLWDLLWAKPFRIQLKGQIPEQGCNLMADLTFNSNYELKVFKAEASHLSSAVLDQLLKIQYTNLAGIAEPLIGDTFELSMQLDNMTSDKNLKMVLHSSQVHLNLAGQLSDQSFVLSRPAILQAVLSPSLIQLLDPEIELTTPSVPLKIVLNHLTLSFSEPEKSGFKLQVEIPGFTFSSKNSPPLTIQPFHFLAGKVAESSHLEMYARPQINLNGEMAALEFQGVYDIPLDQLEAGVHLNPLLIKNIGTYGDIRLEDVRWSVKGFPLSERRIQMSSDIVATQGRGTLAQYLGPRAELKLSGFLTFKDLEPLSFKSVHASLSSQFARLQLEGDWNTINEFVLNSPATIHYELPPSLKKRWDKKEAYTFPLIVDAILEARQKIRLATNYIPVLRGNLIVSPFKVQLENGSSSIELNSFEIPFTVDEGRISGTLNASVRHDQSIEGSLTGDLELNWNKTPDLKIALQSTQWPVAFSSLFLFNESNQLQGAFGPYLDLEARIDLKEMRGPVLAQIKGKNGRLFLDGKMTEEGLTLSKPLVIEVKASPQLNQEVFQKILPIFSGLTRAENPLHIVIDPKGFLLPLANFSDLNALNIGLISFDLGRTYFNDEGQIGKIMHLLKVKSDHEIPVWFTPIYLSLQKGLLKLERFDMQVRDKYPLALWGQMSFLKDKVNLRLAVSGPSLQELLGFAPADPETVLQIPLVGKTSRASIDKAAVAAQVAALAAQQQGSKKGSLLGSLLKVAHKVVEEDLPPPTTQPFPWD